MPRLGERQQVELVVVVGLGRGGFEAGEWEDIGRSAASAIPWGEAQSAKRSAEGEIAIRDMAGAKAGSVAWVGTVSAFGQ
jgi:hypothetical protein